MPGQFEKTAATQGALRVWIKHAALKLDDFLFLSRLYLDPCKG